MDVSHLISPGLANPVSLVIFIAGVTFVTGFMASVTVMIFRPDVRPRLSLTLALVCLGCTAVTLLMAVSYASGSEAGRNAGLESALLDNYGFTVPADGPGVDEIQEAGEEGIVARLNRDGNTHEVRLRIADGQLTVTVPDGAEIPANA